MIVVVFVVVIVFAFVIMVVFVVVIVAAAAENRDTGGDRYHVGAGNILDRLHEIFFKIQAVHKRNIRVFYRTDCTGSRLIGVRVLSYGHQDVHGCGGTGDLSHYVAYDTRRGDYAQGLPGAEIGWFDMRNCHLSAMIMVLIVIMRFIMIVVLIVIMLILMVMVVLFGNGFFRLL